MRKILIVDDDRDTQWSLSTILQAEGYEAAAIDDGRKALKKLRTYSPDIVLLDFRLPGMDGMEVLSEIKEIDRDVGVIMLTAYGGAKEAVQAMKLGAFDYITKPFNNEELVLTIKKALLASEVGDLKRRVDEKTDLQPFKGESPAIKQVMKQVAIVAPTNMTVVIQGESGTGKGLVARLIHQKSPRRDKPFVTVDCGTLPENLVESELFGYEKGAFTGANGKKEGKFEAANSGTIFLDEISNLSLPLQAKLLRVLQERKLQRIGSTKEITIDVRVLAATNKILSDEVKKGSFREDLYHRLNEFDITLPPLRERKDDMPLLVKHFIKEANFELDRKAEGISGTALQCLLSYHWPGNARELKNTVRKAVLMANSNLINEVHLNPYFSGTERFNPMEGLYEGLSLRDMARKAAEEVEKSALKMALENAGNNKTRAARLLRIDRMTLYSKMKAFKL
ncbi:MAG: sigma-54 dependent transcriptional regulator [Thermodesulfovibrionales bacterium]|nr:sigma-54 dependent transcriptional regulator [Thermodesulfovibrionales bacterium]